MLNKLLYILETELSFPPENASYLIIGGEEAENIRLELLKKGFFAENEGEEGRKYDVVISFGEAYDVEKSLTSQSLLILVNCPKSFKTAKKYCRVIEIYNKQ